MKTLFVLLVAVFSLSVLPRNTQAQFGGSSTLIGPHIGLGSYEGALSFGGNFETAVNQPGQLGDGVLGVSVRADYTSFDWGVGSYYTWSLISIGAFCNYHFKIGDGKFDPFVGLGLGYHIWDYSYDGPEGGDLYADSWSSGIYVAGNVGARYYLSSAMALRALLGFGSTYLVVGIDFGI